MRQLDQLDGMGGLEENLSQFPRRTLESNRTAAEAKVARTQASLNRGASRLVHGWTFPSSSEKPH